MGIILRWKNYNYMIGIDISRNYSHTFLGALRDVFEDLGVQMTPTCPAG